MKSKKARQTNIPTLRHQPQTGSKPIKHAHRHNALWIFFAVVFFAVATPVPGNPTAQAGQLFDFLWSQKSLETVINSITRRYPDVAQMETTQLAKKMEANPELVLIDVRETDEYQVSHLPGAIHAPPNMSTQKLSSIIAPKIKDKTVVFYCSVGERSSAMARRAQLKLKEKGAKAIYNLKGGIFAWHNEKRHLVNKKGPTDFVHPFDKNWGRLVQRQELTRIKLTPSQPKELETTP